MLQNNGIQKLRFMIISDTAVVYLARYSPTYLGIDQFLTSYKEFPAGTSHTLYIVAKGFPDAGSVQILRNMLSEKELDPEIIEVDDSIGYDLQAYMIAAQIVIENKICFINTFSILKSVNWLMKLKKAFEQSDVGMVGGTGSFESIRNSWEVYLKFVLISNNYKFDRKMVRNFYSRCQDLNPNAKLVYDSKILRVKKYLGDIKHKRPPFSLDRNLESLNNDLNELILNHEGYNFIQDFPYFPNPHIRTNFFMVNKSDFVLFETKLLETPTKMTCSIVESGFESISRHFLQKGKRLLVVNSDGDFFDIEHWADSDTFRIGSQTKLLCSDNRTDEFHKMDVHTQLTDQKFTYGSLLDSKNKSILGVPFIFNKEQIMNVLSDANDETKISIVVPTRCREANVLQIIKMLKNEVYSNWELIIFRNNANEQYLPFEKFISDPRIRILETTLDLPVTESWNMAMTYSTGEYVVLLGDDDGILQGSLELINKLVNKFKKPEAIFSNILQFMHPGAKETFDSGGVNFIKTCDFLNHSNEPFLLNDFQRKSIIDATLNLDRSFYFAVQPLVFRKDFSARIGSNEKTFMSIFPDYFFSNLIFFNAKNLVLNPIPISFQGISTKSFGANMMQNNIKSGFKDLKQENFSLHPVLARVFKRIPFNSQDSYITGVADAIIHVLEISGDLPRFNLNKFLFNYYLELRSNMNIKNNYWRFQYNFLLKGEYRLFLYFTLSKFKEKIFTDLNHFDNKIIIKSKSSILNKGSFTSGFEIYEEYKVSKTIHHV